MMCGKLLSHQGFSKMRSVGADPGNYCLTLGWHILTLAAGIRLPVGQTWPDGKGDLLLPHPLSGVDVV